jgi:hypothetical protein
LLVLLNGCWQFNGRRLQNISAVALYQPIANHPEQPQQYRYEGDGGNLNPPAQTLVERTYGLLF